MTANLNDWYGISISTSKDDSGLKPWVAKGDIFRRDNNEPVDTVSGFGTTTTLAEQDAKNAAYNNPILSARPSSWHPVL